VIPVFASGFDDKIPDQQSIDALTLKASLAPPREQCFLYAELVHQMTELSVRKYAAGDVGKAAELLRHLASRREGLTYVEPAGLRAVAEDALALMEERPASARARAAFEPAAAPLANFVVPRRYARIPLEAPLRAQMGSPQMMRPVRVRTISLGGAYLESPSRLSVGDSIQLEVRAGLRKIHFTAVVRNIGPDGGGVEFVHMKDEDRERLRKLVQRHLHL